MDKKVYYEVVYNEGLGFTEQRKKFNSLLELINSECLLKLANNITVIYHINKGVRTRIDD